MPCKLGNTSVELSKEDIKTRFLAALKLRGGLELSSFATQIGLVKYRNKHGNYGHKKPALKALDVLITPLLVDPTCRVESGNPDSQGWTVRYYLAPPKRAAFTPARKSTVAITHDPNLATWTPKTELERKKAERAKREALPTAIPRPDRPEPTMPKAEGRGSTSSPTRQKAEGKPPTPPLPPTPPPPEAIEEDNLANLVEALMRQVAHLQNEVTVLKSENRKLRHDSQTENPGSPSGHHRSSESSRADRRSHHPAGGNPLQSGQGQLSSRNSA